MVKINLYNLQISITTKFLHQLRSRASLICVQFDYGLFLIDIVSSDNQGEIWVALKETKKINTLSNDVHLYRISFC